MRINRKNLDLITMAAGASLILAQPVADFCTGFVRNEYVNTEYTQENNNMMALGGLLVALSVLDLAAYGASNYLEKRKKSQ